jgi:proton glutamate symport protein
VSLLTMTVIPLVVSLLITSIASAADSGKVGRVVGKALLLFLLLYLFVASAIVLISPFLFAFLTLSSEAIASFKHSTDSAFGEDAEKGSSLRRPIVEVIPTNPFAAAADGEILPLVVFSILFGLAVARIRSESRQAVMAFFQRVADAMLVIMRWIERALALSSDTSG